MRPLDVVRSLAGDLAEKRLQRRARGLTSERLIDWADATVPAVGRALGQFTREGRAEGLSEARMGAAALLVVLDELEQRRAQGRL